MPSQRFLGIDLAWSERDGAIPNETGVAVLDREGRMLDAGWTSGVAETSRWVDQQAGTGMALLFVDAPLVVDNPWGQRVCEREVGQRYGRWKVSANTTNQNSPRQAGVALYDLLTEAGWRYSTGHDGPGTLGRTFSECYPYTTLVDVPELGYVIEGQRPRYKRKPRTMPVAQWRPRRAAARDELIKRLHGLRAADPPLQLMSHPLAVELVEQPSPLDDRAYKHREASSTRWYARGRRCCGTGMACPAARCWGHLTTRTGRSRRSSRPPSRSNAAASEGRHHHE